MWFAAMIQRFKAAFPWAVLLGLMACGTASQADMQALENLRAQHGSQYLFEFKSDLYLEVVAQRELPTEIEAEALYRFFFLNENGKRRRTTFVYMNFYDNNHRFQYQLAFDPKLGRFIRSKTEYY